MKVLFLAAGYGSRLERDIDAAIAQSSATATPCPYAGLKGVPKALLPLGASDALLTHWLHVFQTLYNTRHPDADAYPCSVDELYIVTNRLHLAQFHAWADRHGFPRANILDNGTDSNAGRMGAVADMNYAMRRFDGGRDSAWLIVAGDTLLLPHVDVGQLLLDMARCCLDTAAAAGGQVILTHYACPDDELSKTGIVELQPVTTGSHVQLVTNFLEKPALTATTSRMACPCLYRLRSDAVPLLDDFLRDNATAPLAERDAPGKLLAWLLQPRSGGPRAKLLSLPIDGRLDVGGLQSYVDADQMIMSSKQ